MSKPTPDTKPMSDLEYDALYERWRHARDVAFESVGQADRAENVAYRDELAAQLERAGELRAAQRRGEAHA